MPVSHVHSESELRALITGTGGQNNNNGDKLLLIDFSAEWCGPCKMIAPIFEKLSNQYGHANFLFIHVDVDECTELAHEMGIRAMPTFIFFKNATTNELARLQGANAQALEEKIRDLGIAYQPHFTGQGNRLGGGAAASGPQVNPAEVSNLTADEIAQIAQANIEYSLAECCRVGFRLQPSVQGGVLTNAKPFVRVNGSERVGKLRDFVDTLLDLGGVGSSPYELHSAYPPAKLDEDRTINDSSVAGAVVVIKFI